MTKTPFSIRKIQVMAGIFLACWILICAAILFFRLKFNFLICLTDSMVSNGLLAAACILLSNIMGYYQPKKEKYLFLGIMVLILAGTINLISKETLSQLFIADKKYLHFLIYSLPYRALLSLMCLSWCVVAHLLWYQIEEQTAMQQRLLQAQNLAKEAELNKLRHQLQPHFLFNSLNSVYALTITNSVEAGKMITKLATFLRGTLKRDDEVWVSVADEMEYIQLYLDIEKIRFNQRLNIDTEVADNTLNKCMPGTLLQPIVENAIKFGLYNTLETITITIRVGLEQEKLVISIANPYDPEMKAAEGIGFGLSAIKRRLYLQFGDTNLLQTDCSTHKLFMVTLKIPLKNDENNCN